MMSTKKDFAAVSLAVVLLAANAGAQAGLEEGIRAYRFGHFATALKEFKPLAESGDARAQTFLGDMYGNGNGVPQDQKVAAAWYLKAAKQGDAAAQFSLGVMCENGLGVRKSDRQAASWFHKAAEQGYGEAQYVLGRMYENGRGAVPKDLIQAHKWHSLAVMNGFEIAAENVEAIEAAMTPAQIETARTLVRESKAKRQ